MTDPFSHSADVAWNKDTWKMSDQHTEQQAKYRSYPGNVYQGRVKSTKTFASELVFA